MPASTVDFEPNFWAKYYPFILAIGLGGVLMYTYFSFNDIFGKNSNDDDDQITSDNRVDKSSKKVSIISDISEIYSSHLTSKQIKRYESLISSFKQEYQGQKPDFIVRSPGRVNIIGEHIDYCGYDVLPMAVEKDILFACKVKTGKNDHIIELSNKETKFTSTQIDVTNKKDTTINLTSPHRHWSDYFLAAFHGVRKHYGLKPSNMIGLRILVDGNLPKGSGLSSSSAFVCGSSVLLLYSNGEKYFEEKYSNSKEIASMCIECEHEVGVDSGGMDQTICMMAEKGYAKHIQFIPKLNAHNVKLPNSDKYCFVISNCLKEHQLMDNSGTQNYNTRVVECRLATLLFAKYIKIDNWEDVRTMRDIQNSTNYTLSELLFHTMDLLKDDPYTIEEIEYELFGDNKDNTLKLEDLMKGLNTAIGVLKNLRKLSLNDKYKLPLQARMLHVYSEANRVLQFRDICKGMSVLGEKNEYENVVTLGKLMNESHVSCRDRYECSCEELDLLQSTCLEGGALGSRLTGAGWGGCVVSLVEQNKVNEFEKYVKRNYYGNLKSVPLNAMFETTPSCSLTIVLV